MITNSAQNHVNSALLSFLKVQSSRPEFIKFMKPFWPSRMPNISWQSMNGYYGERELVTQPKTLLVRSFVILNIMSCGFFGGEFWGFNAKISASCFPKKKKKMKTQIIEQTTDVRDFHLLVLRF